MTVFPTLIPTSIWHLLQNDRCTLTPLCSHRAFNTLTTFNLFLGKSCVQTRWTPEIAFLSCICVCVTDHAWEHNSWCVKHTPWTMKFPWLAFQSHLDGDDISTCLCFSPIKKWLVLCASAIANNDKDQLLLPFPRHGTELFWCLGCGFGHVNMAGFVSFLWLCRWRGIFIASTSSEFSVALYLLSPSVNSKI